MKKRTILASILLAVMLLAIFITAFVRWQISQQIQSGEVLITVNSLQWDGKVYVNRLEINAISGKSERVEGYQDALVLDVTIINHLPRAVKLACVVEDKNTKRRYSSMIDANIVKPSESLSFTQVSANGSRTGKLSYAISKTADSLIIDCNYGIKTIIQ